jgi:hypothetical protein
MPKRKQPPKPGGRLRIGDDWNAINIIALSQQSPLKAVAEFVENSIDAHAGNVTITRGKEAGKPYLKIVDDGQGVPRGPDGLPDFPYVATHICDSLKRYLKERDGIQGEFGIGLLSFWTLGQELTLTCAGADGRTLEMRMRKGNPRYTITDRRRLFPEKGTEVVVKPLLPGIRHLSGEKIQWFLASELRDRIKSSGVRIRVVDHQARAQYQVVPREFTGRLLHQLPAVETPYGEVYLEIYLDDSSPEHKVGLYRHGTRVLEDIAALEAFQRPPWTSGFLQGIVDAPFLTLTPGTRSGVLQDEQFSALWYALAPVETALTSAIDEQRRAADEQASKDILRSIHRAFREALLALPAEEYDWFQIPDAKDGGRRPHQPGMEIEGLDADDASKQDETGEGAVRQKEFFEFPGPLYSVVVSPSSSTVPVGESKNLRAIPRDRGRRPVEEGLVYQWQILEGGGTLENSESEIVTFRAPQEPGLSRIRLQVKQGEVECEAEGLITVTDALIPDSAKSPRHREGLPAYTFERAPGELWRSRYDEGRNLILINNAHRDFIYASKNRAVKLRYICRLYIKELVQKNFPGLSSDKLLERMVELSLYTEEHLR